MVIFLLYIIGSLVFLYFGANLLVRGAASLAERLGISALVVGLTVVSFGTGMPELIVSTQAAVDGYGGIAIGNVIGSNLSNIGLVLGLSALVYPLKAQLQLIRIDTPIMLLTAIAFLLVFLDHRIGRIEGAVFIAVLAIYTTFKVIQSKKEKQREILKDIEKTVPKRSRHWGVDLLLFIAGLGLLIIGSRFLVENAVGLARMIGLNEAVIGLTIVSIGTSMPELAISIVAAFRKQPDIAIGNVIGSNIFNVLGIIGVSSLIRPVSSPDISLVDMLVMIGMSLLLLPFIKTGYTLQRWEGGLLLTIYVGYIVYLLL